MIFKYCSCHFVPYNHLLFPNFTHQNWEDSTRKLELVYIKQHDSIINYYPQKFARLSPNLQVK